MEKRILIEVEMYVDTIQRMKGGEAFNPECLIRAAAASSVILNMLFGRRFQFEDPRLLDLNNTVIITTEDVSPIVNVIPWIRFVRSLERFGKNCHILQTLVEEEIKEFVWDIRWMFREDICRERGQIFRWRAAQLHQCYAQLSPEGSPPESQIPPEKHPKYKKH